MDEIFESLTKVGKNTVNGIIEWMTDAKVIDGVKLKEEKAREAFADVADANNVDLEKFKETLTKLATEQKKNLEDFAKVLAEETPRVLGALQAGASAFKEALAKK